MKFLESLTETKQTKIIEFKCLNNSGYAETIQSKKLNSSTPTQNNYRQHEEINYVGKSPHINRNSTKTENS